jgi:DNA-binding response OmpR family regulator
MAEQVQAAHARAVGAGAQLAPAPQDAPTGTTHRILVVDGDSTHASQITHQLERHGYAVDSTQTGSSALELYRAVDLVLLSLELPDMDGVDLCRGIRSGGDTPMIVVNPDASELDCVLVLQAGADDFIAQPFGFRELNARVQALLRRARIRPAGPAAVTRGPLHVDTATREVRLDGALVDLTRKEFNLLYELAAHADTVLSRDHLIKAVWGETWSRRTLDTHISSLRMKLGGRDRILTVRGVGFRLGDA